MKKFISLLIALITALCITFGLSACDDRIYSIYAGCIFDNDTMTLPIKFDKAYALGYTQFYLKEEEADNTIQNVKSQLDNAKLDSSVYSYRIYGNDFLLIEKQEGSGKLHYYMVMRSYSAENAPALKKCYCFICPTGYLSGVEEVLFPYHLMGLTPEDFDPYFIASASVDRKYRISGTREEITDFYRKTNEYDITEKEYSVDIKVKDSYVPPRKEGQGSSHSVKPFTIEFGTDEEGSFAIYRMAE